MLLFNAVCHDKTVYTNTLCIISSHSCYSLSVNFQAHVKYAYVRVHCVCVYHRNRNRQISVNCESFSMTLCIQQRSHVDEISEASTPACFISFYVQMYFAAVCQLVFQ